MISPFTELTAEKLNDCRFLPDLEAKFQETVQSVHEYNEKYGLGAKKAKAVLTVTIEVESVPVKAQPGQRQLQFGFGLTTKMDVKRPKDHPVPSVALCVNEEDGKPKLFVQASGSFDGDPAQQRLCTEDGRGIDPMTGVISEQHTQTVGAKSCA
jgi:hypothetical protein